MRMTHDNHCDDDVINMTWGVIYGNFIEFFQIKTVEQNRNKFELNHDLNPSTYPSIDHVISKASLDILKNFAPHSTQVKEDVNIATSRGVRESKRNKHWQVWIITFRWSNDGFSYFYLCFSSFIISIQRDGTCRCLIHNGL